MNQQNELDGEKVFWGFFFGLLVGAVAALFVSPRSGTETRRQLTESSQQLREKIEATVTPSDPVADSIAEGKAAARRRRSELGLDNGL